MTKALKASLALHFALHFGALSAFAPHSAPSIGNVNSSTRSSRVFSSPQGSKENDAPSDDVPQKTAGPDILLPFLPAIDPMYKARGEVGGGEFVVSREDGPKDEELTNENLYGILYYKCSDLEVNTLVWKCLGYRFDIEAEEWRPDDVFPKWKEKFPSPPDLIGMQRVYSKEVDTPSLKANQQLVKSIPKDNKQSLKEHLKPMGFTGFKV
jgi:hypothetical protein